MGRRIRSTRRARGWTQARLAAKAGIRRETVYRIELGRMPTTDVLARVCDVLRLDRSELDLQRWETDGLASHPAMTLLRDRRRRLGLTLAECATAARVSAATLSRFERGQERSGELASFDANGVPRALVNAGLARVLEFSSVEALDRYWRSGRDD